MLRFFLHSKIHRASVTSVNIDYEGSLTIDPVLLEATDMRVLEQIHVLNINNGNRFVTYIIEGERNSGIIQVNGAAAHLCKKNDKLIIISYCQLQETELENFKSKIVYVDEKNSIKELIEKSCY